MYFSTNKLGALTIKPPNRALQTIKPVSTSVSLTPAPGTTIKPTVSTPTVSPVVGLTAATPPLLSKGVLWWNSAFPGSAVKTYSELQSYLDRLSAVVLSATGWNPGTYTDHLVEGVLASGVWIPDWPTLEREVVNAAVRSGHPLKQQSAPVVVSSGGGNSLVSNFFGNQPPVVGNQPPVVGSQTTTGNQTTSNQNLPTSQPPAPADPTLTSQLPVPGPNPTDILPTDILPTGQNNQTSRMSTGVILGLAALAAVGVLVALR